MSKLSVFAKMNLKIFILILSLILVTAERCSKENTVKVVHRPVYEFSVRLLEKISIETKGHFVYSPLFTWLQLTALAEGARNTTLKEILTTTRLTRHRRLPCYRKQFREIVNELNNNLEVDSKMYSVIIVDKFYKVKRGFKKSVEKLEKTKVLSLNFDRTEESAAEANEVIKFYTNGVINEVVYPNDFVNRVLIMSDAAYFKSAWKSPFNVGLTEVKPFYTDSNVINGHVNMMQQYGIFNITEIQIINAKILELPCKGDVSLLVFLPLRESILDIYYLLKYASLKGIYNSFKLKPVNVSLPRFEIDTEISNIRELLLDMGVERAFYPEKAQLKGISDFKLYASLMTQLVKIEVTENYVQASVDTEFLFEPTDVQEFNVNKPFAYMLVDRKNDIIMFAGMYSQPTEH